jgi:hypothetical protein
VHSARDADAPRGASRGSVLDPMKQLAYLNSGSAFRASLVPSRRTIFLSTISRFLVDNLQAREGSAITRDAALASMMDRRIVEAFLSVAGIEQA